MKRVPVTVTMRNVGRGVTLTEWSNGHAQLELSVRGEHVLSVGKAGGQWIVGQMSAPDRMTADDLLALANGLLTVNAQMGDK